MICDNVEQIAGLGDRQAARRASTAREKNRENSWLLARQSETPINAFAKEILES
jgi:hypothetical protein